MTIFQKQPRQGVTMCTRTSWLVAGLALSLLTASNTRADTIPESAWRSSAANRPGGSNAATATVIDANPYSDGDTTAGKGNDASLASWVGGNDNAEEQSRISGLSLDPGTYYAVVDGAQAGAGSDFLNASWTVLPPKCDGSDSDNTTVIDQIPYVHSDDTSDDCDDILIDCDGTGGSAAPDHWYEVTFDADVYVDVTTTCNSVDLDTEIAILDQGEQVLYCSADDPGCGTGQASIDDALLASGTYFIVVDGQADAAGPYTVQVDTTHAPPGAIVEYLPDLTCRENELYDNDIVTNIVPDRVHLRVSNATPNTGTGKLYVYGTFEDNGDGTQDVLQRIWNDGGGYRDQEAGTFLYHPAHNHIHLEAWSAYRLREIIPPNGVGPVVAEGDKTSFCVLDLMIHDSGLPGFSLIPEFVSCAGSVQGLSIGWADIYNKTLTGQSIDITDVPEGTYWLEAEVDPDNHIKETDETNNITRIQVTVGQPQQLTADPYEPDDDLTTTKSRVVGAVNSPNLGPTGPQLVLSGLTQHTSGNDDVFRFYMPAPGQPGDEIRIDFTHTMGDLDLHLLNDVGSQLDISNSVNDFEAISMVGHAAGWYAARVYGFNGATNAYSLTIDPSANNAPSVTVDSPPVGNEDVFQGTQTYPIEWTASDIDGNLTWVTVYVNTTNALDGNELRVDTSLHTDGSLGQHVFNTAEWPLGTYYVYCEITDGGSISGDWSEGTMTLIQSPVSTDPVSLAIAHLKPARPNPFNPSTVLELVLPAPAPVWWRIYDIRGQLVRTLQRGPLPAGSHQRVWHARDDRGRRVASGVYLQAFDGPGIQQRQKLVIIK